MIEIKICGLTNPDDAAAAAAAGADYLGFVFYPASPRAVSAEDVIRILDAVPVPVRAVGVFVNASPTEVIGIAGLCGLYAVQLHGDESAAPFEHLRVRLWRALRVSAAGCSPDPDKWPASRYVVDAAAPGLYGGTGVLADWERAAQLAMERPVLLAGGLTPDNVGDAVRAVHPWGVDVVSGVEAAPGRKDLERMSAFIRRARAADAERGNSGATH